MFNFTDTDTYSQTAKIDGNDVSVVVTYKRFSSTDQMRLGAKYSKAFNGFNEDDVEGSAESMESLADLTEGTQSYIADRIIDVSGVTFNGKRWADLDRDEKVSMVSLADSLLFKPMMALAMKRADEDEKNE